MNKKQTQTKKGEKKKRIPLLSPKSERTTSIQCGVGSHRPNPVALTAGQRNGGDNGEKSRGSLAPAPRETNAGI